MNNNNQQNNDNNSVYFYICLGLEFYKHIDMTHEWNYARNC